MMNFSMLADLKATYHDVLPITQQDIQLKPNQQIKLNSNNFGGFFLLFLLIGYMGIVLNYKKNRLKERKATRLQQIKNLEKIWKMPAYRRKK